MSHPSRWLPIAKAANLSQDGSSQKFFLHTPDGFLLEGLIIRKNGQLFAYANRCPHMPLSLDYGDGEFFDEARDWLICRNHGAVFDPQNGRCVAGPCYGASLEKIPARLVGDSVEVLPPTYYRDLE